MGWPFGFWNGLSPCNKSPIPSFGLRHYFDFLFPSLSFSKSTKRGASLESCAGHSVLEWAAHDSTDRRAPALTGP